MKINYEATIQKLQKANLILPTDVYAVAQDSPSTSASMWGGALGAALSSGNIKNYIISANSTEIRIFDIDKQTGEYLNTFTPILISEAISIKANTFIGKTLKIKCQGFSLGFLFGNKFNGYEQKDMLAKFMQLCRNLKA